PSTVFHLETENPSTVFHLETEQPGNLNGYKEVQNVENQVAQNPRVQNIDRSAELIR
nr:hypothetical protein [Tanacetum cinerariifolium]